MAPARQQSVVRSVQLAPEKSWFGYPIKVAEAKIWEPNNKQSEVCVEIQIFTYGEDGTRV